ncbi:MAG: RagB/SusD family nutrient uptake outer membrane protein [Mangrovibacterium sp.]|nr:RagB/SusD family nutrient uptake outer membrane protein [Mangrovibacterium sp.]
MKNTYLLQTFIVLCFLFYSCEKDLDLTPKTTYSEATFFKTTEQFKLFANQFYSGLPSTSPVNDRDTYSDVLVSLTTNTISNGSYFPTPTSGVWDASYATIRNTTYLVMKGDEVDAVLKTGAAAYVGEAKFFRALAYFNLFRDFGGVPIIDKVLDLDDEDLLFGPRNSRDDVFNYMMKDLNEAIEALPLESAIAANDKGRVSKGAALSLKARVTLFEGTWRKFRNIDGANTLLDQAIDASGQVISSAQYQIFDRRDVLGDESYRYFFILDKVKSNVANLTKADQKEYILATRFDASLRKQPLMQTHLIPNPTKKFADMFLCADGLPIDKSPLFQGKQTVTREYENRDLRMKNIFFVHGTQAWESYPSDHARDWSNPFSGGFPIIKATFGLNTTTGYMTSKFNAQILTPSMDFPIIRYAEVLLINAEALYEKNGAITDAQLDLTINKLRERAGVAKLSNALVSSNGLDMRTEIRRERTIELFLENQRFDDLRRWKTAETEMPQALKGVLWTGTQYATDPEWSGVVFPLDAEGNIIIEDASKRSFTEKHYLFPLPTRQLLLNPQLEQNPGWE